MSKKAKLWLIISICLLVVIAGVTTTLFLVLKKDEPQKTTLETPTIELQRDGNKKLLISRYNPNATDYVFYIYSGEHPDRTYDYAPFTASESQTERFYLDVTDIFVDAKDYYFYCKLIGDKENFDNSPISEIKSFANKKNILTPRLSLTDKTLSWTKIANSDGYEIEINGVTQREIITTESVDISQFLTQTNDKTLTFRVKALGKEFYFDSEYSNTVSFTKTYTLAKVQNVAFNSNNNVLSWGRVINAQNYEIVFNESVVLTTKSTSYDFSSYITDVGVYKFKVRAVGNDDYKTGEYSTQYIYTKTKKLAQVSESSLTWTIEDERVRISWDKPQGAETYYVVINGQVFNESLTMESIYIKKPEGSSLIISIYVNGYGYYEKSNTTIKQINL